MLSRNELDPETGLPNYDGYCRLLQGMMAASDEKDAAVVVGVVDLDPQARAHPSAAVINEVAHRLLRHLGRQARVGRLGPRVIGTAIKAQADETEHEVIARIDRALPTIPGAHGRPAIGGVSLRRSDGDHPGRRLRRALNKHNDG